PHLYSPLRRHGLRKPGFFFGLRFVCLWFPIFFSAGIFCSKSSFCPFRFVFHRGRASQFHLFVFLSASTSLPAGVRCIGVELIRLVSSLALFWHGGQKYPK